MLESNYGMEHGLLDFPTLGTHIHVKASSGASLCKLKAEGLWVWQVIQIILLHPIFAASYQNDLKGKDSMLEN
jgi:hypothetical protein